MQGNIMGFSLYEQINPVNQDITITFSPDINYPSYKITIYKDEKIYKELNKNNNLETSFTLSETGTYKINVIYYDAFMNQTSIESGIYNIDKEPPILDVGEKYIEMSLGSKIDIMGDVKATDNFTKNLTEKITTNSESLNFNTKGIKKLIYTVSDEAGNTKTEQVTINILPSQSSIFIFQTIFMIILFILIVGILIYNKSIRLEKKISRFSINPIKDNTLSLFEKIEILISKIIKSLNKVLCRSEFIKKYSKKYKKYIISANQVNKKTLDFVSSKIICALICIIIMIFSKTMQLKPFKIYDIYLPFFFGLFLPDIIYYLKYRSYKRKMENDLLQAIIIMNNAFKSGRSIVQAINLVSKELEGPMAEEFKKMYLELSFGLGMDVVFSRFSNRIDMEEVSYLTASLTILNKSGGNIVKVFSSIEKSLFNKRKLRLELASLTSGTRMIVNVLMIVPIAFILLIRIVNPTYFLPLLTNPIGYILIVFMIIYYIIYIICVRKLLKVKI